ncbi:MAG: hypothetical protein IVW57_14280 [Ktedonobacterales bacterium]|nr:hypothetical protein [Ktedonobacterales bacterium]
MGIFDTLFGRQKPVPVGPERLFAMSTAQITLETEQHLTPTGKAGICFKSVASAPFTEIQHDLEQLLQISARDDQMTIRPFTDELAYRWFLFESKDFQGLVTTLHVASQTLIEKGYDSQLLFALFSFRTERSSSVYWIYNYKRGLFYPFVPQSGSDDPQHRRDNAEEMRLATAIGKELPVEQELERWYPVWNLPL